MKEHSLVVVADCVHVPLLNDAFLLVSASESDENLCLVCFGFSFADCFTCRPACPSARPWASASASLIASPLSARATTASMFASVSILHGGYSRAWSEARICKK